ncbi:MFS transporter [Undibacterium arcticum]
MGNATRRIYARLCCHKSGCGHWLHGERATDASSRQSVGHPVQRAFFAVGSMMTGFAGSLSILAILRFITGIGLGAVLPAAVALAAKQCPAHRREMIAVAVAAGIGLGSTLGGVFRRPVDCTPWLAIRLLARRHASRTAVPLSLVGLAFQQA